MRTLQLQFPDTALPTLETVLKESKEVRVFRRVAWRSSMKFKQGVLLRRALSQKREGYSWLSDTRRPFFR